MTLARLLRSLAPALLLALVPALRAVDYYVSAAGNDTNPGTSASAPWRTLAKVNSSTFVAGDTINLRRGDKWRETLVVPSAGTQASPIVIRPYGSGTARPIINGSEPLPATGWEVYDAANNIYRKAVGHVGHMMWVNGAPMKYRVSLVEMSADLSFRYETGYVYVRDAAGNPNTTGKTWELSEREYAVSIVSKPGVTVQGLQFENTNSSGVNISASNYAQVIDCVFRGSNSRGPNAAAGINAQGSRYIVIKNNRMDDMFGEGFFGKGVKDCLIEGNVITKCDKGVNPGGDNIQLSGTAADANDGFQVINNWVSQQGYNGYKGCIQIENGSNGVVRGNTALYGTFGVEINGSNLIVERNTCAFQGLERPQDLFCAGIYLSEKQSYDNVTIRYNLIYRSLYNGINLAATNGSGTAPYNRTNFKIHNNTIAYCGTAANFSTPVGGYFENNIVWGFGQLLGHGSVPAGATFTSNRNVYGPLDDPTKDRVRINGVNYKTLAALQAAGHELNSGDGHPEFFNEDLDDYRPYSISSAASRGQSKGAGLVDLAGASVPSSGAVTAGAYQALVSGGSTTHIVIADDNDATGVTKTGAWTSSTSVSGYFDAGYIHDNKTGKGTKSITFAPSLPAAGTYKVFMRWATGSSTTDRADNVPVDIVHSGGTDLLTIDQKQKSGAWTLLGIYDFAAGSSGSVTLANTGTPTTAFVTADAVRFEKARSAGVAPGTEVIVDNTNSARVTITGTWTTSTDVSGFYGTNYLHDGNGGKGSRSVRFTPDLPGPGNYEVFIRYASNGSNRANNVPVSVTDASGTSTVTVNQQLGGGTWVSLGVYTFNGGTAGSVLVSNTGTTSFVIADAIRFVAQ